jgi:hypothetical protein
VADQLDNGAVHGGRRWRSGAESPGRALYQGRPLRA